VTIIIHSSLVHMLDQRTKSFCFGEWDRISVCVPQSYAIYSLLIKQQQHIIIIIIIIIIKILLKIAVFRF